MSYQNEWLLFEAEDEFDEIKHREPTEELLFYRAVASGDIKTVKKNCERQRFTECDGGSTVKECGHKYEISFCYHYRNDNQTL